MIRAATFGSARRRRASTVWSAKSSIRWTNYSKSDRKQGSFDVRILGVIPARIGSERLARKPLQLLGGRPLIEVVWRRVASFNAVDTLIVATDSEEIAEVCRAAGAEVEMTSSFHR